MIIAKRSPQPLSCSPPPSRSFLAHHAPGVHARHAIPAIEIILTHRGWSHFHLINVHRHHLDIHLGFVRSVTSDLLDGVNDIEASGGTAKDAVQGVTEQSVSEQFLMIRLDYASPAKLTYACCPAKASEPS